MTFFYAAYVLKPNNFTFYLLQIASFDRWGLLRSPYFVIVLLLYGKIFEYCVIYAKLSFGIGWKFLDENQKHSKT